MSTAKTPVRTETERKKGKMFYDGLISQDERLLKTDRIPQDYITKHESKITADYEAWKGGEESDFAGALVNAEEILEMNELALEAIALGDNE